VTSKWAKRVATDLHGSAALLGTVWAIFELVRQNASAAYTTSYGYNDAGEQISQTSPTGMRAGSRPGMRMADPGRHNRAHDR
jgi:hypothetical protein